MTKGRWRGRRWLRVQSVHNMYLHACKEYARYMQGFVRKCMKNPMVRCKLLASFCSGLYVDTAMFLSDGCTNVDPKRI